MVVPTILTLEILKNSFRDGVFFGQSLNVAFANDTQVNIFVIRKEDFAKLMFQLKNTNASAAGTITYEFFGAAESDIANEGTNLDRLPPPDFDTPGAYTLLTNGQGVILDAETDSRIVTDNWTWILLRALIDTGNADFTIEVRGE